MTVSLCQQIEKVMNIHVIRFDPNSPEEGLEQLISIDADYQNRAEEIAASFIRDNASTSWSQVVRDIAEMNDGNSQFILGNRAYTREWDFKWVYDDNSRITHLVIAYS